MRCGSERLSARPESPRPTKRVAKARLVLASPLREKEHCADLTLHYCLARFRSAGATRYEGAPAGYAVAEPCDIGIRS
jgi:hypothetical protein